MKRDKVFERLGVASGYQTKNEKLKAEFFFSPLYIFLSFYSSKIVPRHFCTLTLRVHARVQ